MSLRISLEHVDVIDTSMAMYQFTIVDVDRIVH
jgi:hypothetical protein